MKDNIIVKIPYKIICIQLLFIFIISCSKYKEKTNIQENITSQESVIEYIDNNSGLISSQENITSQENVIEYIDNNSELISSQENENINIDLKEFIENNSFYITDKDRDWVIYNLHFNTEEVIWFKYKEFAYSITPLAPPGEPWIIGFYELENEKIFLNPTVFCYDPIFDKMIDERFKRRIELKYIKNSGLEVDELFFRTYR
jgi:hypothetical protein